MKALAKEFKKGTGLKFTKVGYLLIVVHGAIVQFGHDCRLGIGHVEDACYWVQYWVSGRGGADW